MIKKAYDKAIDDLVKEGVIMKKPRPKPNGVTWQKRLITILVYMVTIGSIVIIVVPFVVALLATMIW